MNTENKQEICVICGNVSQDCTVCFTECKVCGDNYCEVCIGYEDEDIYGFSCNNEECGFFCKKCREIPDEVYCRLCGDNLGTFCSDCKDHYCPCWVNKLAENTERQFREEMYNEEIQ